ncbi:MAG: hypothetical protein Q9178_007777 [Gyalolechia marmorata]
MRALDGEPSQKRQRLQEAAPASTWKQFLIEDATVAREAFKVWFSEVYLKTPEGASLPKDIEQQVYFIIDTPSVCSVNRNDLLPGTIDVLETWEKVPLVPGTREWAIARARLVGFLLINGLFGECEAQGLNPTKQELAEARLWLHKQPDGTVSRFEPVRQPWHYKDLYWTPGPAEGGTYETVVEAHLSGPGAEIKAAEEDRDNPESLRISSQTLQELISIPIESEETSIKQVTQGGDAEKTQLLRCSAHQNPGEPAAALLRSIERAGPVTETETEEDKIGREDDKPRAIHPTLSTESNRYYVQSEGSPSEQGSSPESEIMVDTTNGAWEKAQEIHSGFRSVQHTTEKHKELLKVPGDGCNESDIYVNTDNNPWDDDSLPDTCFDHGLDAVSEGDSSGVQIIEGMTKEDETGGPGGSRVGWARARTLSIPSSLIGEAEFQDEEDDELHAKMEPEGEAHVTVASLFAMYRQRLDQCFEIVNTTDSEASTEILDNIDAGMAVSGGGLDDEADKENRPTDCAADELHEDKDDKLETRIVERECSSSEDELAADTNVSMIPKSRWRQVWRGGIADEAGVVHR